ncbi:MAG: DNA methyltransferase, partial [Halanaerobiales bacterium]
GSYRCGNMWFASNENTQPSSIKYLKEVQNMLLRSIISLKSDGGIELKNLFAEKNYFSYPKPTSLIKRLIYSMQLKSGDIVMDFFSGSATTADAVMQLNADDGENRRYIMVQLPEKIKGDKYKAAYKAGYQTIDEIGRARIEKAARKIKVETINDIDYGYKLYRLNKPKQNTLDKIVDFDPTEQIISENMIEEFCFENVSGKETILSTWLNEDGYGLGIESNKIILDNYEADVFKNSIYIIEEGLTSKDVMELIRKIENNELNITRIVIYSYSINFNQVHELKNNVKNLRNNKNVSVIERY